MAEISDLTAASALTGAELMHVVQGGNSRQAIAFTVAQSGLFVAASQTTPPGGPSTGDAYIVTATATGAWAGQEGDVAIYDGSAWDFLTPVEGWRVWDQGDDSLQYFNGSAWAEFTSGGASAIDDLSDVDTSTSAPTDGQALLWSASGSEWVPGDVAASGTGATSSRELITTISPDNTVSEYEIDVSEYSDAEIFCEAVTTSANSYVILVLSTDGGSTYKTTSGDYSTMFIQGSAVSTPTDDAFFAYGRSDDQSTNHVRVLLSNLSVGRAAALTHGGNATGVRILTSRAKFDGPITTVKLYTTSNMTGGTIRVTGTPRLLGGGHTATTTELEDATDAINTTGKYTGKMVYNTTTGIPVWSSGTGASDTWDDATGATDHTPV